MFFSHERTVYFFEALYLGNSEGKTLFAARKREILTKDKTTKSQSNRQKLCGGQMKGHLRISFKT